MGHQKWEINCSQSSKWTNERFHAPSGNQGDVIFNEDVLQSDGKLQQEFSTGASHTQRNGLICWSKIKPSLTQTPGLMAWQNSYCSNWRGRKSQKTQTLSPHPSPSQLLIALSITTGVNGKAAAAAQPTQAVAGVYAAMLWNQGKAHNLLLQTLPLHQPEKRCETLTDLWRALFACFLEGESPRGSCSASAREREKRLKKKKSNRWIWPVGPKSSECICAQHCPPRPLAVCFWRVFQKWYLTAALTSSWAVQYLAVRYTAAKSNCTPEAMNLSFPGLPLPQRPQELSALSTSYMW